LNLNGNSIKLLTVFGRTDSFILSENPAEMTHRRHPQ